MVPAPSGSVEPGIHAPGDEAACSTNPAISGSAKLVTRMQNLLISVQASGGVDGKFQAVCGSTDDANTLAQLLQLALVYQQYQASNRIKTCRNAWSSSGNAGGDRVTLRMSLSDDQMAALIKKNTFALKM